MVNGNQCVLQASISCLPLATAFLEELCGHHDIAPNDRLRLTLITEELFRNTVLHGPGADGEARARLALTAGPTEVVLVYEDTARPFDPFAHVNQALADLDAPIADRRVDGFGLVLIMKMATRVSYVREGDRTGWPWCCRASAEPVGRAKPRECAQLPPASATASAAATARSTTTGTRRRTRRRGGGADGRAEFAQTVGQ